MKTLIIQKPNKSKTELLVFLESQLPNFKKILIENNAKVTRIRDGFTIELNKTVFVLNFFLNATIICEDGKYVILYETNAPEYKVDEFKIKITDYLKNL